MAKYTSNDTNLVLGNDLYLYLLDPDAVTGETLTSADQPLAFATSCSLSTEAESIDTSNKMSCRWAAGIAGNNSYTISSDALYTTSSELSGQSFDYLMSVMVGDGEVGWAIGQCVSAATCDDATFALDTTKTYYFGLATISSLSLEAGNNEVATCSVSLTGNGAINQVVK